MKLSEALRIIDDTVGMFRTFVEIILYGNLKKDFLSARDEYFRNLAEEKYNTMKKRRHEKRSCD